MGSKQSCTNNYGTLIQPKVYGR